MEQGSAALVPITLFDNKYGGAGMENHSPGNAWIKKSGKDVALVVAYT